MKARLIRSSRAIAAGWGALIILTVAQRIVVTYGYRLAPSSWWQTAEICLALLVFTAAGWVVGRLDRPHAPLSLIAFSVSLLFFNLGALNVPFTAKLVIEVFGNPRYIEGLLISLITNGAFLAAVWIGGTLGRGPSRPTSLGVLSEPRQ